MIEAQTQKQVSDVTRYTPANPTAAQFMTDEEKKGLHLDDPNAYMQRIISGRMCRAARSTTKSGTR